MRSTLLLGLLALALSPIDGKERRPENKLRRYGPFGLKDKRGAEYISNYQPQSLSPGIHSLMGLTPSLSSHTMTRALGNYQGLEHSSGGQGGLSLLPGHGIPSMGISLGGHGQTIYTLPMSSIMSSSKSPIMFGLHTGLTSGSNYRTYSPGVSSISGYPGSSGSSSPAESSYGSLSLPASGDSTGLQTIPQSHGISGGLVFLESPQNTQTYHTGLSSGSSDSSSYNLPISDSKYRISSAGSSYASPTNSYSFPSTNYGIPSNSIMSGTSSSSPTVHYSPPSSYTPSHTSTAASYDSNSINYASPGSSYSQSDYSNHSPSNSYGYSEPQTSYSHVSSIQSSHTPVKAYDEYIPKYDTISYSSPRDKY
ncbi:probable ATP-dependent RNA helicase ddx17 [Fopius arisanus]|uniref:Probable ATP-dependent RNA helicase ddx17 n=1 Tax=Fopius arisanus TaxID=64838 RepID=A0A9R1T1Q9_9HYME|nr:PREDICTED: probable ATP-dependent RNA helicase ddx17 [Fopius arisanus]